MVGLLSPQETVGEIHVYCPSQLQSARLVYCLHKERLVKFTLYVPKPALVGVLALLTPQVEDGEFHLLLL